MAGPYTCKKMLVKIDGNTIGVVTGTDIELLKEKRIEHVYGSAAGRAAGEGRHARGGQRATFRIQRWFLTDTDTDLLFDLFDLDLPFSLSGELDGIASSKLNLSNCEANRYRLITGDAHSTVGEEISGEATSWAGTEI